MTPLELEQCVLLASNVTCPKYWEATAMLQAWSVDCGVLLTVITTTQHEQVLFYCLTTFPRCSTCNAEQRAELRTFLLAGFPWDAPPHLHTKAAVVLAHLFRVDFPHAWSTAFEELQQQAPPQVFFRTLLALQEDTTGEGGGGGGGADQIRDAMRGVGVAPHQSIAARLVDKLLTHVAAQEQNDSILLLALQVLQKFASWMDLSLLVQDRVMTLVFGSLSSPNPKVGVAAVKSLQELIGRGMDGDRKLALLAETEVLRKLHRSVNLQVVDASPIEVVIEVAKLIDATGQELAPMMEHSNNGMQSLLWPQVMELFFRCLAFDDIDVSGAVLPLAGRLTTVHDMPASQLLSIMYRQMMYPADYQFDYENDDEAEEEVYRGELRKLYQKLVRACPQLCLQFLCQALANLPVPLSSAGISELEAALRLVYHYSEGIRPPPGLKVVMKNETFRAVLVALQQSDIRDHSHREVLLLYYEISVRYYPLFLDQPELLPKVLESLSGERGLQHSHPHVSSRSCYLLLRLVKSVVNVMRPYVETAVTGIQGLLSNTNSYQKLRPDDVLYLFETMGLLLGKTGLAPSEQQHSLARVIAPHIQSMEEALRSENLPHDPECFGTLLAGSIAAIAYLSKGFRRAPMEVQVVFAEPVRVSLAVLEALPGRDHVRAKVMILLQCMIQCIGSNVLPTMSRFVQLLIEHCTTDDVQDVAQLLNQLCIKFKEEAIPSVDPNLLPFLGKCHQLVPSDEQVAKGDIPPHLRTEQLSVKKLTFTVLQHIVTYRVSPVLLSPTNAGSLELVLQTMSDSAMHVDDPVMKKVCLTFFRELVDQWATDGDSSDVSGFVRFVFQVFLPGMIQCFLSPSFNEKDALQARNVTEFANILFILKSKQGNEKFEQYVVHTSLASAGCPQHVLEAFRQVSTVQEMELCLKETLKALKQKSTG